VLKTSASIVKENLLGCHVVAVENISIDRMLRVETLILPDLLASCDVRGRKSARMAGAACAAGGARRTGRAATSVAAAGAAVVADLVGVFAGERESTGNMVPTAGVLESDLLYFFERERIAFVHVGNKFAVGLLMCVCLLLQYLL
jgi:hypothetical protein